MTNYKDIFSSTTCKGGQNIPNAYEKRPPPPNGSTMDMNETKQVIWKFETKVKDTFSLDLPEGSTFVHAAPTTGGIIVMWFMVFPDRNKLTRKFYIVATGQTVPEDGVYLATVVDVVGPPYVWHLFQQARNTEGLGW